MAYEHEPKHAQGPGPGETEHGLDLAGQSLGEALRWSFRILTGIIVILVLFFLFRGIFRVIPEQKALVVRFGKADVSRVMGEGLHYAWPSPIDEVVRLSISDRILAVNTFWPRVSVSAMQDELAKAKPGEDAAKSLSGAIGAYMLTGDLNIVEGLWEVTYGVMDDSESVVKYFTKVAIDEAYPYDDPRRYTHEQTLMKVILQAAAVREIGRLRVTDVYPLKSAIELRERVRDAMRQTLRELDCGIEVKNVNLSDIRPPKDVLSAFEEVLQAVQESETVRIGAEREMRDILIGAAGEVGLELGPAIDEWWKAREEEDAAKTVEQEEKIRALFGAAEGDVQSTLAAARTYRTRIVSETKGDADRIKNLVEQSPVAIKLFLEDRHVAAMEAILAGCYEKFLFSPGPGSKGALEIWMNRRPELLLKQRTVPKTE